MRVPAVVGSFPEPFVSGSEGRKLPVRIVCLTGDDDGACDEVETRLADAGVTDTARSVLEQSAGREVLRVLVGPWSQVRRDTAARKLESGPAESGVFARPDADRRPDRPARRARPRRARRSARAAGCSPPRGSRPSSRPGSSPASTRPASARRPRR